MTTLGRVLPGVLGVYRCPGDHLRCVLSGVPGVYRCPGDHLRSGITWCIGGVQVSG